MGIPKSHPIRFTPKGLVDAFDATDKFPGACVQLANCTFDSSNPELVVPRPGVVQLADLAALGMASPTFVSVQVSIGTRVYGMVATTRNAGHDEPFCYDTTTGALIVIGGILAGNTPTSPASSGDWTPPVIAQIGVLIIITHPGFNGAGTNFFGVIDVTNPAVPVYSSQNLVTNPLPSVPTAVANFNNRAWFAFKGSKVAFSDVLVANTRTNATQQLVVGDDQTITALAGLPLQTTSSGVIGALTVLKTTQVWQITGDSTTNDLALNYLSLTVGTAFPRSVAQSPAGLYFIGAIGPCFIDPFGAVRPVTNRADSLDPDLQVPFTAARNPSRWCAAYTAAIYRVSGPTTLNGVNARNDYWFDERRRRWVGPQSFVYDCASVLGNYFVLTAASAPGLLLQHYPAQRPDSVFSDLTLLYSILVQSSTFPKIGDMCTKQVTESQIELGSGNYLITAADDQGNAIASPNSTATITGASTTSITWGSSVTWGSGLVWASSFTTPPLTYPVPWTSPLVFEKMQITVSAVAARNVQVGTFYALYQKTGYMTLGPST